MVRKLHAQHLSVEKMTQNTRLTLVKQEKCHLFPHWINHVDTRNLESHIDSRTLVAN